MSSHEDGSFSNGARLYCAGDYFLTGLFFFFVKCNSSGFLDLFDLQLTCFRLFPFLTKIGSNEK